MTSIEWTEATWNPTTGCDRVSPGCDHCYALTLAARLKAMGSPKYQADGDPATSGPGFGLTVHPDALQIPLRKKAPTTYFVNSMSDLFHRDVPDEFIAGVLATMNCCPQHTFQVLTKRPQRMAQVMRRVSWDLNGDIHLGRYSAAELALPGNHWYDVAGHLPQTWFGTSIETDRYAFRANHLRAAPAAVRFLSLEPLLGPLPTLNLDRIDWVIVGAESGRGARPMDLDWVRPIRDACIARGIPFFFKQAATAAGRKISLPELDGHTWTQTPGRP